MVKLHLDFEVLAELDIKKAGAWKQSLHHATIPLCLAWKRDDEPTQLWCEGMLIPLELLDLVRDPEVSVRAHNAAYEIAMWHNALPRVLGHELPQIPLKRWTCTAAKAALCGMPRSLVQVAEVLGLESQKDMDGKKSMMKLTKYRRPSKKNPDTRWRMETAYDDFERMWSYCRNDVDVEAELDDALPEIPEFEHSVWRLDQRINMRGVRIDTDYASKAIECSDLISGRLVDEGKALTGGISPSQVGEYLKVVKRHGSYVTSLDRKEIKEELKRLRKVDPGNGAIRLLEIRDYFSRSSVTKYQAMFNGMCEDGRARELFLYSGAHTRRWAGKRVQLHNLFRGILKKDEMKVVADALLAKDYEYIAALPDPMASIASLIRGALVPAEGYKFWIGDFAAVEARVTAWLAGQDDVVEIFRTHGKYYEYLASKVYNCSPEDIFNPSPERQLGKVMGLALGFGMGVHRFIETALGYGIELEFNEAEKVVKTFREQNKQVVDYWYALQKAAILAVRNPGRIYWARSTQWQMGKRWLRATLPSGGHLYYYQPWLQEGRYGRDELWFWHVNSQNKQWEKTKTWGGTLCENVVQSVARDMLTDSMIRFERHGYPIVLHVHDELVAEVPNDLDTSGFEELMSRTESWADGCPIGVEGSDAWRYRK